MPSIIGLPSNWVRLLTVSAPLTMKCSRKLLRNAQQTRKGELLEVQIPRPLRTPAPVLIAAVAAIVIAVVDLPHLRHPIRAHPVAIPHQAVILILADGNQVLRTKDEDKVTSKLQKEFNSN